MNIWSSEVVFKVWSSITGLQYNVSEISESRTGLRNDETTDQESQECVLRG